MYREVSAAELEALTVSGIEALLLGFSAVSRDLPGGDEDYLAAVKHLRKALRSKKKRKRQEEEGAAMANAEVPATPEVQAVPDSAVAAAAAPEAPASTTKTPNFGRAKDMSTFTPPAPTSPSKFRRPTAVHLVLLVRCCLGWPVRSCLLCAGSSHQTEGPCAVSWSRHREYHPALKQ